ncbi:MAG: primosomal replication protein N [Casimicrobiaceae bacterium]
MSDTPAANRFTLDAKLAQRDDLRFTPAGIPVLQMTLSHTSMQAEAGGERKVECELAAIAFADVARKLATIALGAQLSCEGFIARRFRTGMTVALHISRFDLTER